eukprot:3933993-Rhodomonas_salina.3
MPMVPGSNRLYKCWKLSEIAMRLVKNLGMLGTRVMRASWLVLLCLAVLPRARAFSFLQCPSLPLSPFSQVCGLPTAPLFRSLCCPSRCSLPASLRMREEARETGIAARWNEKGFGFIEPDMGGEVLFCHAREILDGSRYLSPGSSVEYTRRYDRARGKEEAAEVTILRSTPDRRQMVGGGVQQGGRGQEFRTRRGYGGRDEGPRESGVAVRWNEKGFGFIEPDSDCGWGQASDWGKGIVPCVLLAVLYPGLTLLIPLPGGVRARLGSARGGGRRFKYQRGGGLEELSDLMAKFYAIHKPEKVAEVFELANDFLGHEEEYNGILFAKYGAASSVSLQGIMLPVACWPLRLHSLFSDFALKFRGRLRFSWGALKWGTLSLPVERRPHVGAASSRDAVGAPEPRAKGAGGAILREDRARGRGVEGGGGQVVREDRRLGERGQ